MILTIRWPLIISPDFSAFTSIPNMHEGCTLPFIAHGRCPICGEAKQLLLPSSIRYHVLKPRVSQQDIWTRIRESSKGFWFYNSLPDKVTDIPGDIDLIWLPFVLYRIKGGGYGYLRYLQRAEGLDPKPIGKEDLSGPFEVKDFVSLVPDKLELPALAKLGLANTNLDALQAALLTNTEQLGPHHLIPNFEPDPLGPLIPEYDKQELGYPLFLRKKDTDLKLANSSMDMYAIYQDKALKFDDIEVSYVFAPVYMGYYSLKGKDKPEDSVFYLFSALDPTNNAVEVPVNFRKVYAVLASANASTLLAGVLKGAIGLKLVAKVTTGLLAVALFVFQFMPSKRRPRRISSLNELVDFWVTDQPWAGFLIICLAIFLIFQVFQRRRHRVRRLTSLYRLREIIDSIE